MIEQAQDSTRTPVAPITTEADGPPTPNQSSTMSQSGENLSKTNLYIRGLATTTTDQDLYNMCAKFGDIVSTKAIQDKTNGCCRGYGFVQFATSDAAETAVNELTKTGVQAQMARVPTHHGPHSKHYSYQNNNSNNSHYHHHPYKHHNNHNNNHQNNNNNHHGSNNHNASGSNVTNNSHSHGANSHSNMNIADPTNLYLANLPLNMTEHELENLLSSYGPVVSTRILRDEKNNPRGVGFARMETRDKCQEIIEKLNGKPYKGSQELLLVKFADGGNRKRHQNNHHHHHHHHNSAHHKMSHDDNRWHESGDANDQNVPQSGYDHQRNLTHANHMAEMPVMGSMGYPRMQPTFPPTVAANAPYPTTMGPPSSADHWIHPSQGQAWNVIPQQMIPPNNLGPSGQAAVPSYSYGHMPQLTSQMQGLQLTHHSGAPMSGYIPPHWSHQPVWPHHIPPHQQQTPQSVRPTAPLQPSPTSSQQQIPQVSTTGATQTSAAKQENPPTDASKQSNSGDTEKQNLASVRE